MARQVVLDGFTNFITPFEGVTNFMYADTKGLVTTGIGNLIDPIGAAMNLPWLHNSDNSPASADEITAEWNMVKNRTDLDAQGGFAFKGITTLHLTQDAINTMVLNRLDQNEGFLRARYPNYDQWPADAQMGVLDMAWNLGASFNFPKFAAAVNASPPDFATAATESKYQAPASRNAAHLLLFNNADMVQRGGLDPDTIYWPGVATQSASMASTIKKDWWIALLPIALGVGWYLKRSGKI